MNLFGLGIANPIMWMGIYALAIPVFIHLLTRRTPVRILFPTLRFLKGAKANQSRLFRIRHILLLLLRTALLALVLGAFLRPTYQAGALSDTEDTRGHNATIIVVDTSLSMGFTGDGGGFGGAGVTPFARGQAAAERIIDELGNDDRANLIFASSFPTASFEGNIEEQVVGRCRFQLKRDLQNAQVGVERADVDAAIAMAVKQLEEVKPAKDRVQREIHFISDFQRTNWAAVNYSAIPEDVKTVFVSVGAESTDNTSIAEVQVKPPYPAVGESVELTCKVANYGMESREIPLELTFDGQRISTRTLTVAPGMTASVSFRLKPNRVGIYEGSLTIPDDAMNIDNTRFFALSVTERLPVTILTDEPQTEKRAGHRFLCAALNPYADQSGILAPTVLRPEQFDTFAASRSHVVLITGVGPFSEVTTSALLQYLRDGGGVIYFVSDVADKANLQSLAKASDSELQLPYTMGSLVDTNEGENGAWAMLYEANYDHPMLKAFRETGALAELKFYRYFETEREKTQGQVLLRYDNGYIALASQSMGLGSLLVANFSVDLACSDVARHTVFVPLVHKMVGGMRPESGSAQSFVVGGPCSTTVTLSSSEDVLRFTSPSGEEVSAGLDIRGNEGAVLFGAAKEIGFYRAFSGGAKVGAIAVNVDSREGNLEALTLEQLEDSSNLSRAQFHARDGSDVEGLRQLRHGVPIWHYLLLAALAVLAMEQLFVLVWKR